MILIVSNYQEIKKNLKISSKLEFKNILKNIFSFKQRINFASTYLSNKTKKNEFFQKE
jgi:hypothetical protein